VPVSDAVMWGADRDAGAVRMAAANAARAGVAGRVHLSRAAIGALERPPGPPGLVLVNPPYGARIGERRLLFALYGSLGAVLRERFAGWRVGVITADEGLARATGLPFAPPGPPVPHGGLTVRLWQAGPLG
jgi:putative N6-adenine-specific DNA methylase